MVDRGPPDVEDLAWVGLAAAAWAGARVAEPVAAIGAGILLGAIVGPVVARMAGARRAVRAGVRSGLVVAALLAVATSVLAARALDGLAPVPDAEVTTTVVLLTDPRPVAGGRIRFEARLLDEHAGSRVLAVVSTPVAKDAVSPLLAGEQVRVRGRLEAFGHRSDWLAARHLRARLEVDAVEAVGRAAPHAAAANGLRRVLVRGAASLPEHHRALLAGLTLGDDRAQPAALTADFRAAGMTHLLAVSGQIAVTAEGFNQMVRALIYTRVSHDQANGRSVAEQEADSRAVAERNGWEIAEVVTDSVGASRHSRGDRLGWRRARKLLEAGDVDVLVTWEASRAQRDLAAYSDLRDLCARTGTLWCYSGRVHDLTDAEDRFRTGIDALIAEREADETSERVRRAMRHSALAGRPPGRRLFGYERVYDLTTGQLLGQRPHPTEAAVVARIFDEYLAGDGTLRIARRLNDEGITTGTGARWSQSQVNRVLKNPAYVARRVHRGEVVGPADWPPLVTEEAFERAQAAFEVRSVRPTRDRRARLLSGVARCGVCLAKVAVVHDHRVRRVYQCRGRFCVSRDETKLDAYVTARLLERLAAPDVADRLASSAGDGELVARARAEVAEMRARLEEAVVEFGAGRLTASTLARVEADLGPRIADAERALRSQLLPIEIELPDADVGTWWKQLVPERRRVIVGAFIDRVMVLPTGKGRRTFRPDHVEIVWRV